MRILLAMILFLLPYPAVAQLKICNNTDVLHSVAISYQAQKTWISEGWWKFGPGECGIVMQAPLDRQNYYFRVQAKGHDYGGNFGFCTDESPFKILGDTDCKERGYERELFNIEDTGPTDTSWSIQLNGAPVAIAEPKAKAELEIAEQPQPLPSISRLSVPELEYVDYRGAFEPGEYGEPTQAVARFISCVDDNDGEFCRFSADGVDWLVYPSDANYSETFTSISFLTPGQRVYLDADIVAYNDASVEIAVGQIEAITEPNDMDRIYFALQGQFSDPSDPRARVEVIANTMLELYDNKQTAAYRFSVAPNCDGTDDTGPAIILSEPENGWSNCAILGYVGADGFDYVEMGMLQGPSYRR